MSAYRAPNFGAQPRLKNTVAIVTGASRGIGFGIAQRLASEGASLCLIATSEKKLATARAQLQETTENLIEIALDVSDAEACQDAVAQVMARFGRVDTLVNNAGIYLAKPFEGHTNDDFQRLLNVNLFGVINMSQAALPIMRQQSYGRIINIASTAGKSGSRNQIAYNTSKHAVVGFTRCLALESASDGITVNAICPGFVKTDLIDQLKNDYKAMGVDDPQAAFDAVVSARVPIGRPLVSDEISGLAALMAAPESGGMTGQSVLIDGGMITA